MGKIVLGADRAKQVFLCLCLPNHESNRVSARHRAMLLLKVVQFQLVQSTLLFPGGLACLVQQILPPHVNSAGGKRGV